MSEVKFEELEVGQRYMLQGVEIVIVYASKSYCNFYCVRDSDRIVDIYGDLGNFSGIYKEEDSDYPHSIMTHHLTRIDDNELNEEQQDKLTIRDQFAMSALNGFFSKGAEYRTWEDAASDAYDMADAMLKARKVNNG